MFYELPAVSCNSKSRSLPLKQKFKHFFVDLNIIFYFLAICLHDNFPQFYIFCFVHFLVEKSHKYDNMMWLAVLIFSAKFTEKFANNFFILCYSSMILFCAGFPFH
jgi:hypothetical protein